MARKPRVYTSVNPELKAEVAAKAEELKMSSSEFLEMCLRDGLGHFNVYQENKQLKEKNARLETELSEKTVACHRLTQSQGKMQGRTGLCQHSVWQVQRRV